MEFESKILIVEWKKKKKKLKEMFPDIHGVDGMLFLRRHQTFYVLPEKK